MKHIILVLTFLSFAQAKVEDFNSIINEDIKAQKELHKEFKKNIAQENKEVSRQLNEELDSARKKEVIVLENTQSEYIAPSSNQFLKFKKEIKQKAPNLRKNQHRVAKEIKELDI